MSPQYGMFNVPDWDTSCDFCGVQEFKKVVKDCVGCRRKFCPGHGMYVAFDPDGEMVALNYCEDCIADQGWTKESLGEGMRKRVKTREDWIRLPKQIKDGILPHPYDSYHGFGRDMWTGHVLNCDRCGREVPSRDARMCEKCERVFCPECTDDGSVYYTRDPYGERVENSFGFSDNCYQCTVDYEREKEERSEERVQKSEEWHAKHQAESEELDRQYQEMRDREKAEKKEEYPNWYKETYCSEDDDEDDDDDDETQDSCGYSDFQGYPL